MATCQTVGCDRDALFGPICAMCGSGHLPSLAEIANNAKKPQTPWVDWVGSTEAAATEQEKKAALNLAGNAASKDGSTTLVEGLSLHHQTTPRANFSIWYLRLVSGVSIRVYGIGTHKGTTNTKYAVTWHDGKVKQVNL